MFKILKDKNFQPRILYPAKISFRYEGEIKSFPEKQKLRDFIATRTTPPHTQEILKAVLIPGEEKGGERCHKTQSNKINRETESE